MLPSPVFLIHNASPPFMTALVPSPIPRLSVLLAWLALGVSHGGCDGCSKEPKVPFKLGSDEQATGDAGVLREQDAESHSYPSAVDRPEVDGQQVPLDFVRAILAHDLDSDGDRDVLALVHDTVRRLRLAVSTRDGDVYQAAADVNGFAAPGDETCTVREAALDALSPDKAVLSITQACGDPQTLRPPSLTLISLEAAPRVYERFEVLGDTERAALTLRIEAADRDADGHADFLLHVAARVGDAGENALELAWLDRASGLSQDAREPEATFAAWASAAQTQLAKAPEQASATAERVLSFERLLCRERGMPEILVSGSAGIACGQRKAVSQALATLVLARSKLRQVPQAVAAFDELSRREAKPDRKTLERVLAALAGLPRREGITLREGPRVELSQRPALHLPDARFVDDARLVLHRTSPVLYDLDKAEETALSAPADGLIRDPSGELVVTNLERDLCGGVHLRIERAPRPGAPYAAGALVSTPLLTALNGRPTCKQAGAKPTSESGYQVLGWAPQGVVAAQGRSVLVVPLSLKGDPLAEPFEVPEGAPLPAPLPSGISSPDGARYVQLSPAGVLVFERSAGQPELWRPDGYAAIANSARQVAVSPSGRHIAVVAHGTVYILSRP